ncbi:TetR/AcrR family transcriptional regulator [Streptomyces hainanensis]|uniref:TetR/AcrR family transcriptional regulator n=1 Tax=Streptomyces hainanensis TaxID=402648 RepID=A0A4R4TEP3_9ACTN|nr:TetR/AcrR family transcriptional regulator [Streptomyces hainanensis]TDC75860.1 TetR/AcrR family transcriptional regulator [Streptomyces hainanensis]
MARVSQEHLEARRQQILEGAARVFAREGFHRASMQDVLRETGLSAGAVYRYFPSKDAMILALATSVLGVVRETFESLPVDEPPNLPDDIVRAMERVWSTLPYAPALLPQVWTETLRNPELAAILQEGIGRLVEIWTRFVETYQRNGWMRDDVPAHDVARTLLACVQGFMLQRVLLGNAEVGILANGLRGLMSVTEER